MKLREIAGRLGCCLEGDGDLEISGVAGMEHAGPGQLTFLANPKYGPKVKHTQASAILVDRAVAGVEIAFLISENPYLDFARALELYYRPPRPAPGIHPLAYVAATAAVGENCSIGPFAVVGERVRLGRNAVLHPHVVLYEGAQIGDDFLAHSHATVREFCRIGNRVFDFVQPVSRFRARVGPLLSATAAGPGRSPHGVDCGQRGGRRELLDRAVRRGGRTCQTGPQRGVASACGDL